METKNTRNCANFKRIRTTIEAYDPLRGNYEWETVTLEAYHGELSSIVNGKLEEIRSMTGDFLLVADDPIHYELIVSFGSPIWRLRAEDLLTFIDWKHIFIVSRRPDLTNGDHCEIDNTQFSLFNRKHQCKFCGLNVCKNCCREKAYLHSLGYY